MNTGSRPARISGGILIAALVFAMAPHRLQAADPEPAAEIRAMTQALSGTWTFTITRPSADGKTPGEVMHGTETWRTLVGGLPLVEEYSVTGAHESIADSAAFWWDAKDHALKGLWCVTILDRECVPFRLTWKPGLAVMEGDYEQNGAWYDWHEEFRFTSPDAMTQTLDIAGKGKPLKTVSRVDLTRAKAGA